MRYWLCCDGGGTKFIALLVSEDLEIICEERTGGVNANFISLENIRKCFGDCLDHILKERPGLRRIESCCFCGPAPMEEMQKALAERGLFPRMENLSEGYMGLLAGTGSVSGLAALSGTGSDVWYDGPAGHHAIGGWGMLLGDDGSGGDIGQKGVQAAVRAIDGWGEPTLLVEELRAWLGVGGSDRDTIAIRRQVFGPMIEQVYHSPSYRQTLASFAPHVEKACEQGDQVATAILRGAGRALGMMMNALITQVASVDLGVHKLPSTVCGGAWRTSGLMFASYKEEVRRRNPAMEIIWPRFDMIAGAAAHIGLSLGYSRDEIFSRLDKDFGKYRYPPEKRTQVGIYAG